MIPIHELTKSSVRDSLLLEPKYEQVWDQKKALQQPPSLGICISFLRLPKQGTITVWLKTTESYCLRILKSRCWQGHVPSEACRGESFLASSWPLVFDSNPWHSLACQCTAPVSASIVTWGHVLISHIGLRAHSTLVLPHHS